MSDKTSEKLASASVSFPRRLVRLIKYVSLGYDKKNKWYGKIMTENGLRFASHGSIRHVVSSMVKNRHRVDI